MYYREHKGYILTVQEYTVDSPNDVCYWGRCEELNFESRNRELYSLEVRFYEVVDRMLKKIKSQLAKYLVNYVAQVADKPGIVLDTVAYMINVEVNYCDNGTYQIKKDEEVLFYGTFTDVLEDLTLHIFNDRKLNN